MVRASLRMSASPGNSGTTLTYHGMVLRVRAVRAGWIFRNDHFVGLLYALGRCSSHCWVETAVRTIISVLSRAV
jgi:hypothetical protein